MDSQERKFGDGYIATAGHKVPFDDSSLKIDQSKHNSEEERLKTFVSWPSDSAVDPARLAKSGFYYTGKDDEVECFSCHGRIKDWQYGDIVQRKHMELFPGCDFVNNKSTNVPFVNSKLPENVKINRPLSESLINAVTPAANGIQKQMSVAETFLLNNGTKYLNCLPRPNGLNHVTRNCSEIKSRVAPTISPNLEAFFQEMKSTEKRLKTFKCGWPVPFIDVQELASAGFFYLGTSDKVQCPFCGGIVSNWEAGDEPLMEHRRHFPKCTFLSVVANHKVKNKTSWFKGRGCDVCGHSDDLFISSTRNENKLLDKSQEHTKLEDLGISLHRGPAHPQQATSAARLRSFVSWPSTSPVAKEDLATAGFFYIGISDHTKCFHCDGGLCSWESGDDPWVEHARWFRNCSFVRLNKGDDFIKSCISRYSTEQSEEESKSGADPTAAVNVDDILTKTEEAMNSSLIQAILETGLFAPYLVRAAVTRQLKETGSSFTSVDDICEAVAYLQHEMESEPPQRIEIDETVMSTLNIEMQPEVQNEEQGEMEVAESRGEMEVAESRGEMEVAESRVLVSCTDREEKPIDSPTLSSQETSNGNLEEENRFLKDQRLCKVCMDNEVGVVFLPCGHLLSCTLCAPALKICPMCRKSIQATVRAYLP